MSSRPYISKVCAGVLVLAFLGSGCATGGKAFTSTHFAPPNSNVTAMGEVTAKKTKVGFLIAPSLKKKDIAQLVSDAQSQQPGTNTIINGTMDTTTFTLPIIPIYFSTTTLTGTGAKMEVGTQELK